jgi:hypothetical protein
MLSMTAGMPLPLAINDALLSLCNGSFSPCTVVSFYCAACTLLFPLANANELA